MTSHTKNKIIGAIAMTILVGLPIGYFLGPAAFGAFMAVVLIGLANQKSPNSKKLGKRLGSDELITTVLPTTNPESEKKFRSSNSSAL